MDGDLAQACLSSIHAAMPTTRFSVSETKPKGTLLLPPTQARPAAQLVASIDGEFDAQHAARRGDVGDCGVAAGDRAAAGAPTRSNSHGSRRWITANPPLSTLMQQAIGLALG